MIVMNFPLIFLQYLFSGVFLWMKRLLVDYLSLYKT